jgi:hypothetical protein
VRRILDSRYEMNTSDQNLTGPQVMFALYKLHDGKDADLRRVIAEHVPTLHRLELATDRPTVVIKAKNGTYIEIFEWSSHEAAGLAHHHPELAKVWEAIGEVGHLPKLDSVEEVQGMFPHFEQVNL